MHKTNIYKMKCGYIGYKKKATTASTSGSKQLGTNITIVLIQSSS